MKNNSLRLLFFLLISNQLFANIVLPNIFSDNMVLQRNGDVKIWGWASPSEDVTIKVEWSNQEYKTKADNQAYWEINLKTLQAGGPFTISLKGYNQITLKNILIGEVWICSGQSNMEMSESWGIKDGEMEMQKANYPNIHFFTVPKTTATSPQNNLPGKWESCTPETMKYLSAVAYFFAQKLHEDLNNVPIGLIVSAWGGTPAEIWIPQNVIESDANLLESAKKLSSNQYGPTEPGRAFNAMINPLVGFTIAGAIWYQGESNVGSSSYEKTFSALITSWRKLWKTDFPFYFVQIAPYNYGNDHDSGVVIRNAQRKILALVPNTGMAVISDVATIDDIHPKDKKTVGIRLANLALKNIYKANNNVANGPLFREIRIEKNTVSVYFDFSDGLHFKDKKSNQFEIAGNDGVFYSAKAIIKNNTIVLNSDKVKNPVTVRYSWKNNSIADLFNAANLPASSFISE